MTVYAGCGLAVTALMLSVWLLSLLRRDASIVDIFWGLGFALVACVGLALGNGHPHRQWLVTTMTTVWGLRLGLYLLWRNHGMGEDYRYRSMRRHHGERFWIVSLITVFGLQGALMWLVSLPVQAAQATPLPARLTWLDGVGIALWSVGLFFESVGDAQLARFKADPSNAAKVMDRGLWRYTRHPNYFGDAVVWWGLFCPALAVGAAWSAVGPAVMTFFLMRVSGVTLLERKLGKTRPGYAEYVRRTSAFVPWFPRR